MDSKYVIGIDELDSQHESIERVCMALGEAAGALDQWHSLVEELYEKLRFHFYAEESIMRVFSYPESQEHRRSHLEVLKLIESYRGSKVTEAESRILGAQTMQVFREQVLAQDMRFAGFLKKNKDRLGIG